MMLGSRTLGTRSLGDSAGAVAVPPAVVVTASVSFAAEASFVATPRVFASVAFEAEASLTPQGAVKIDGGPLRFVGEAVFAPTTRIVGDDYRLVVTEIDGTPVAELEHAGLGTATWESNGYGAFEWDLPSEDPKGEKILPIQREVMLWKGDAMLWRGPIVSPRANSVDSQYQAATPEWHFSRRHFGKADRTNYITNGDFEEGMGGWDIANTSPIEPLPGWNPIHWDARVTTERAVTGLRSLRLEQIASGQPKYGMSAATYLTWEVDPDLSPDGDVWTVSAFVYIPSASWRGPKLSREGLAISRYSTTETVLIGSEDGLIPPVEYPAPIEGVIAQVDDFTPRDQWVRLTCAMEQLPTGEPELIQVRLHAPDGVAYWDRVALSLDEATRFYQTDQALICEGIVQHLQDTAYGKSDLGIDTRVELTGVLRDRIYLHSEHGKGIDALGEFPDLDDGLDWHVETTPTSKTFVTHFPKRGVDRRGIVLEYGRNVEDYEYGWNGQEASSAVIVLGTGDGSTREEGWATDPDLFGGVTVEDVYVAPDLDPHGSDISTLDNRAAERLRVVSNPEVVDLICNDRAIPLIGVLKPGDLVTVRIHRGVVQIDGVRRIVRVSLDPPSNTLTVTVNVSADA